MASKILALLSLYVVAFGQTPQPKDVDGWGKIKWGMTLPEVRSLYAIESEQSDQFYDHLRIKPIQIGSIPMQASLSAKHGSNRVSMALMFYAFGVPADTRGGSAYDFDDIRTLLTQKYGNPSSEENKVEYGDKVKVALWVFPSTSIELKVSKKRDSLGIISLQYTGVDKKALDSL